MDLSSAAAPDILRLPHPDWLHHQLTVTGPPEAVAGFRQAAAGAGVVPWVYDYDQMEEDWFHLMIAPPRHRRTISLVGARILARQLREAVWEHHEHAVSLVGVSRACPFDLHALLPVPDAILRLGPDHPRALEWLWESWGTTWSLRHVAALPTPAMFRCAFWAADWSPWQAVQRLGAAWRDLHFVLNPSY
jgi:hypothetical protein